MKQGYSTENDMNNDFLRAFVNLHSDCVDKCPLSELGPTIRVNMKIMQTITN